MERLKFLLNQRIIDNQVSHLLWFVGIVMTGVLLKRILSLGLSRGIYRFIKQESGEVSVADFVRLTRHPLEFIISLLMLYWAFSHLRVPSVWEWEPVGVFGARMVLLKGFYTVLIMATTWLGVRLIKFVGLIAKDRAAKTTSPLDNQLVPFLKDLGILVWILACFFFALSRVYQVNVWALITSLGIGGLVVALAARETIENLIASVSIMIERPFVIGDAVVLGTISGDIEQIGFRSVRLRTDDSSLVTVPNRLMVSQALENTTNRSYRRQKMYLKLAFDTPPQNLAAITEDAANYLSQHPMANLKPPVVYLEGFGDYSFDILVIYWVNTTDWRAFIEIRQEINLALVEIVKSHEAAFAQPRLETLNV